MQKNIAVKGISHVEAPMMRDRGPVPKTERNLQSWSIRGKSDSGEQ